MAGSTSTRQTTMKKLILIGMTLLMAAVAHSQTFAGVPLSGNVDVFRQKLTTKGFAFQKVITGGYLYKGKIANEEVDLYVMHTNKNRYVTKVAVFFPERYTFDRLVSDYEEKLAVLISKYGPTNDCFDYFKSPYYEGDGYEMQAVRTDNYRRMCVWTEGDNELFPKIIEISRSGSVLIMYENTQNMEILSKEKEELIKNGL